MSYKFHGVIIQQCMKNVLFCLKMDNIDEFIKNQYINQIKKLSINIYDVITYVISLSKNNKTHKILEYILYSNLFDKTNYNHIILIINNYNNINLPDKTIFDIVINR